MFLSDNLEYFQGFDHVKIYYDDGQDMVSKALHAAIDYVLSKNAVMYRSANPREYYFSQVADFICTLELTAIEFDRRELTATDEKFFGLSEAAFKSCICATFERSSFNRYAFAADSSSSSSRRA